MTVVMAVLYAVTFLLVASVLPMASFDTESGKLRVVPDVLFAMAAVCGAVDENRKRAGIMALVTGFLTDVFIMPPTHLSPLLFAACAYYIPLLFGRFTHKNALSAAVSAMPFFLARAVCGGLFLRSEYGFLPFGAVFSRVLLPEFLLTALAAAVLYYPVKGLYTYCARRLD